MQGIAKAVLVAVIVSVCMLLFVNLAFFFPWYSILIIETFNLSQVAANDNYVKQSYYYDAWYNLSSRPIYRDKADKIEIIVENSDNESAIGYDYELFYEDAPDWEKPYRQRGEPIRVCIKAVYPLTVTLWGRKYEIELPVSFSITTIGLRYYKDLPSY